MVDLKFNHYVESNRKTAAKQRSFGQGDISLVAWMLVDADCGRDFRRADPGSAKAPL